MNDYNVKNTESGRIIAGLLLVGAGSVLLLKKMGFFFPGWLFTWPMILILVGIYTGVKNNFRNNSWLILISIGAFFLANHIIPELRLQPYFWPIAIIVAGLFFILRPSSFGNVNKVDSGDTKWSDTGGGTATFSNSPVVVDSSDFIRLRSIFSGVNRNVLSKNFQGAVITTVFGGAELDLSQADITGPIVIKIEVVFGGVKLIVPSHWAIQNEIDGVFHGVDDKRKFNLVPDINSTRVVVLRGSAVFGGVEIRNAKI